MQTTADDSRGHDLVNNIPVNMHKVYLTS